MHPLEFVYIDSTFADQVNNQAVVSCSIFMRAIEQIRFKTHSASDKCTQIYHTSRTGAKTFAQLLCRYSTHQLRRMILRSIQILRISLVERCTRCFSFNALKVICVEKSQNRKQHEKLSGLSYLYAPAFSAVKEITTPNNHPLAVLLSHVIQSDNSSSSESRLLARRPRKKLFCHPSQHHCRKFTMLFRFTKLKPIFVFQCISIDANYRNVVENMECIISAYYCRQYFLIVIQTMASTYLLRVLFNTTI